MATVYVPIFGGKRQVKVSYRNRAYGGDFLIGKNEEIVRDFDAGNGDRLDGEPGHIALVTQAIRLGVCG